MSNLSARWTHPEREGIVVDRMGYADISSWSTGTTKAMRPEVGRLQHVSCPITSIRALREAAERVIEQKPHNSKEIVTPFMSGKREVEKAMKECDETIKIAKARFAGAAAVAKVLKKLSTKGGVVKEYP